jgi:glycosyltransferase involved in cell wall biosynthesis
MAASPSPKVSLIMPSKGRDEICMRSVRTALAAIRDMEAELILVNDSPGRDLSHLAADKLSIVDNVKSGIASARNTGARKARAPILLFVDDDILTSREAIEAHLAFHISNTRSCLNPNWIYPPELAESVQATRFGRFLVAIGHTSLRGWFGEKGWHENALFEAASCASYHLSIERSFFEEIGGYDDHFGSSGEDNDLSRTGRWGKAGARFYVDTRVLVFHNEIDKTHLEGWFERYRRTAAFRPVAVSLGYTEQRLDLSAQRRFVLRQIMRCRTPILYALERLPDVPGSEWIYGRGVQALLAATIADAYYESSASRTAAV